MMFDTMWNGLTTFFHFLFVWSAHGMYWAGLAGYWAAVLAIVVLAINLVARRWLTASQMGLLWGLVLLRLVLPFAPSSPASIHNVVTYERSGHRTLPNGAVAYWTPLNQDPVTFAVEAIERDSPAVQSRPLVEGIFMWSPFIWLAGVLAVLATNFVSLWRFSRKVARSPDCDDERIVELWQRCRGELGVRREIPVVLCEDVSQPAVMGAWRPKLLLPADCGELSEDELRLVMLHELMHVRRWDVAVNWLLVLIRAAQWWNPFAWLAHSRYVSLREQSRDAMVLRHLQAEQNPTRRYSELLLRLAERGSQQGWRVMVPASLLGFLSGWFRHRRIASRLQALPSAVCSQGWMHRCGVLGLLLAIVTIGLTNAGPPPEVDVDPATYFDEWPLITDGALSSLIANPQGSWHEANAGPWTERDYNVTSGVEIISQQQQCRPEELPELLEWDLVFLADPTRVSHTTESVGTVANEPQRRPQAELRIEHGEWFVHVEGPAPVHRRAERVVRAWNRSGLGQVSLETCIATTQQNVLEDLGISWDQMVTTPLRNAERSGRASQVDPTEGSPHRVPNASAVASVQEHVPMLLKVLSQTETKRFVQQAQGDARSNILFSPKVTLFNGHEGQIVSSVYQPFVTGLIRDDAGNTVPQIDIVADGVTLLVAVEITEKRSEIDVTADLTLSDIKDVQSFSTRMSGEDVAVQLPRVSQLRVNAGVRLQEGQTLLLCVPPTYDRQDYAWVMLTPEVVDEELPLPEGR